ncbi:MULTISPECIES: hypothetical protein [Streptosporangium]|uniref:Uncharacterized protein n=1 Tax=Streptosporangium brasiliense TaxID=47480 RepID=A0ABT9RKN5_9ACTN|nr:hypothetical protein [Streptosporangium brasiliense]MDP9869852.1 hypothetical protein [Streptosporangium brasiliense]
MSVAPPSTKVITATTAPSATATGWPTLLQELTGQVREGELGRRHWHHVKLYNALLDALVELGEAYPGGLTCLERAAGRRKR